MSDQSSIEWTDASWNPVTGCSKVSEGCRHCYADRLANRLLRMGNPRYRRGFKVTLHENLLDLPRKWKKPRKVFVNSMSDLFHEEVPAEFIAKMFATMAACPQHTFQALTKRSQRLAELAPELPWPPNLWMGVSVENERVLHRVDDLRKVPAAVRFLSCEPLLGPLDTLDLDGIDWVIAGGESGIGARPMNLDWARSLRDRCETSHVAFFFKQVGGVQKHRTGRHLDGRTHDEMPEPVDRFGFAGSAFQTQVAIP